MTQEEKQIYMTSEPVEKLVCKLAAPSILSMLVTSFYNMADTYFVSSLNTQATGAIGVVFSMMAVIQAIGFMFGHGSGVFISNALGKKETKRAEEIAVTGFFYSFVFGIIIMAAGLIFLEPLALLLGSTDTILPYAKDYLRVILIGAPIMMSSLVMNNQMRYQGNAVYAMVGIITGAVVNIGLDPLFISVFHWGVTGAAAATVISQFISFILLYIGSCRKGNIHLYFRKIDYKVKTLWMIIKGGLPSLCRQGLASIASASMNLAARPLGDEVIAGMTVVSKVMMFINSAMIGFGQGFQPVCGFNYGAKEYERVRRAFIFCVKVCFVFLVIVSAVTALFAPFIVSLFRDEKEVVEVGKVAMRLNCISLPLNAWVVLTNMALQASGKSLSATIAAASRQGLFDLPIIWIFSHYFGVFGIEISQTIADFLSFLLSIPFGLYFLKCLKKDKN